MYAKILIFKIIIVAPIFDAKYFSYYRHLVCLLDTLCEFQMKQSEVGRWGGGWQCCQLVPNSPANGLTLFHNLALKGRNTHDHFSLVSTSLNNRIWKCPFPSKICLIFEAKQMLFHTTSFLIMKDFSLFKVFINLNQPFQYGLRTGLNQKVQKIEWLRCRKVDKNSSKCRCALGKLSKTF